MQNNSFLRVPYLLPPAASVRSHARRRYRTLVSFVFLLGHFFRHLAVPFSTRTTPPDWELPFMMYEFGKFLSTVALISSGWLVNPVMDLQNTTRQ